MEMAKIDEMHAAVRWSCPPARWLHHAWVPVHYTGAMGRAKQFPRA